MSSGPIRLDFRARLLELGCGAGEKQHFGARLRERKRAGTANAASGAAHERGAAVEAKARSDVQ